MSVWHSQTGRGEVRGGNNQLFVSFRQKREVLFLGAVLHLILLCLGFVGIVVKVPVVVPEEVILRMVSVMVLGSVSLSRIGFVSGGTMQACDS